MMMVDKYAELIDNDAEEKDHLLQKCVVYLLDMGTQLAAKDAQLVAKDAQLVAKDKQLVAKDAAILEMIPKVLKLSDKVLDMEKKNRCELSWKLWETERRIMQQIFRPHDL